MGSVLNRSASVSVIVPVFNGVVTLEASVLSLCQQSLQALEIVLVDDGSTDGSRDCIERLARNDARIVPVLLNQNMGVHEARLAGLQVASAPWIGFLDADDLARPDMFARLLKAGEDTAAGIVVCGSERIDQQGRFLSPRVAFAQDAIIKTQVFERFCAFEFGTGMLWNKLYRREVILPWADLRFPWRQPINEDLLLNIGCFHSAEVVAVVSEPLHQYVVSQTSVTAGLSNEEAYVHTYRAYALAMYLFHQQDDAVLMGIVRLYRQQLSWERYQVADVQRLLAYQPLLAEAESLLHQAVPWAASLLAVRDGRSSILSALVRRLKRLRRVLALSLLVRRSGDHD